MSRSRPLTVYHTRAVLSQLPVTTTMPSLEYAAANRYSGGTLRNVSKRAKTSARNRGAGVAPGEIEEDGPLQPWRVCDKGEPARCGGESFEATFPDRLI